MRDQGDDEEVRPAKDNPMNAEFYLLDGGGTGLTVTSIRWENSIPPQQGGLRVFEVVCTALAGRGSDEIARLECSCDELPDHVQREFVQAIVSSPTLEQVVFRGCILPIVGFTGRVEFRNSLELPDWSSMLAAITLGGLTSLKLAIPEDAAPLCDGIAEAKQLKELELEDLQLSSMADVTALSVLVPKLPELTLFSLVLKGPLVSLLDSLLSVLVEHPCLTHITVPLVSVTTAHFEVYGSLMKKPCLVQLGLGLWNDIPFDFLIHQIDSRAEEGFGPLSLHLQNKGLLMSQQVLHAHGLASVCGLHLENVHNPLAANDYGRDMIESILTHPEIH